MFVETTIPGQIYHSVSSTLKFLFRFSGHVSTRSFNWSQVHFKIYLTRIAYRRIQFVIWPRLAISQKSSFVQVAIFQRFTLCDRGKISLRCILIEPTLINVTQIFNMSQTRIATALPCAPRRSPLSESMQQTSIFLCNMQNQSWSTRVQISFREI